jgi:hypothetical protein
MTFFRILLVYFFIQVLPLDWSCFRSLQAIHRTSLHFQDLFGVTAYMPQFIPGTALPQWGPGSFFNWAIALGIAITGGLVWSYFRKGAEDLRQLYSWLRALLRLRLALAIIACGIVQLFHVQIPRPALSDLNTAYGDLLPWKIYYLTTGASIAHYELTLGLLEVAGGLLLLHRRTAVIGAALITALLTNIVVANFAYRIGHHVYSAYLLAIAVFLLAHDIPRLYALLVIRRPARPEPAAPVAGRRFSLVVKGGLLLFVLILGYVTARDHRRDNWPYSGIAGLPRSAGFYNVREFRVNGRVLPYSPTDTVRWRNVVFEPWNSISVERNIPAVADVQRPAMAYVEDDQRTYASAGNAGRTFYSYSADTAQRHLALVSRNGYPAAFQFQLQRSGDSTIVLTGKNEKQDSLTIVLEKIDKKYLLLEGRRKPRKI